MVEERERACDEEVLRTGCEPADYAESILQVCRLYTESPLPCVSGVTGADVKKRLRAILTGTIAREWTAKQKIALATAGLTVFAVPVMIGAATPRFEAASVKLSPPGNRGNYRVVFTGGPGMVDPTLLRCVNMSLAGLIGQAYSSNSFQVKAPQWMEDQMFDISAKVPPGAGFVFSVKSGGIMDERFHESSEVRCERRHGLVRPVSSDAASFLGSGRCR